MYKRQVLEGTTHVCEHCAGTGRVRSVESSALAALRALEIEALKGGGEATLNLPRAVGLYILNEKRAHLARLLQSFGLFVTVVIDDDMAHSDMQIERTASETRADHAAALPAPAAYAPAPIEAFDDEDFEDEDEDEDEDELEADGDEAVSEAGEPRRESERGERGGRRAEEASDGEGGRRRRRRRRRGGGDREDLSLIHI